MQNQRKAFWRRVVLSILSAVVTVATCGLAPWCQAGGGPENVFLLVNSASDDSLTIANHYIDLRKIPAGNVFYLKYTGNLAAIKGDKFRELILTPAVKEIARRGLSGQIDYLVYSCDFPWRVDFKNPAAQANNSAKPVRASLTAASYLGAFVMGNRPEMFSLSSNFYFSLPQSGLTMSRGFRSQYRWSVGGKRAGTKGITYLLSAMLGVTNGRGNSVEEILYYLRRSSEADGTLPKGTVYFVQSGDLRSKTRHDRFPAAARELQLAGVQAEIMEGRFPLGKLNIIGATTGKAQLKVAQSGSRLLPGAFCDNLTSTGGVFRIPQKPPGQTCVSEFLRLGAAGACGTIFEPRAVWQKFPLPQIHVHYARGCSLAEAFYQSVSGPYQQILVGDPLCMPWAISPQVGVGDLTDGATIRDVVTIVPATHVVKPQGVASYELFVDGKRLQRCKPAGQFSLNTKALADGYHELRVVAVENTPIETQGRWIGQVIVKNGRDAVQLSLNESTLAKDMKQITLKVVSTTKDSVIVLHNGRELGRVSEGTGRVQVRKNLLGSGPVVLVAQAEGSPGLRSRPLRIELP